MNFKDLEYDANALAIERFTCRECKYLIEPSIHDRFDREEFGCKLNWQNVINKSTNKFSVACSAFKPDITSEVEFKYILQNTMIEILLNKIDEIKEELNSR